MGETTTTAAERRQIPIVCPGHSRPLAELHYSNTKDNTSSYLISACHDKLPMLRQGDTGDWIGTFEGHKGAVWSATLNSDSTLAATGSGDFTAKLWDAVRGVEKMSYNHKHMVKSVAFSPSGTSFFSACHDKSVRQFDLTSADPIFTGTSAAALRKVVVISPTVIITGNVDGLMQVWDTNSGNVIQEISHTGGSIMDMELSRNNTVLTVATGKSVVLYNVSTGGGGDSILSLRSTFDNMPMSFIEEGGASLHPTAEKFIAGGSDTWVRVFDASSSSETKMVECHKGHHGPIRCLRYNPDGKSYSSGSEDGTIRIWQTDVTTETSVAHT